MTSKSKRELFEEQYFTPNQLKKVRTLRQLCVDRKKIFNELKNDYPDLLKATKTLYNDIPLALNFYKTIIDIEPELDKKHIYSKGCNGYLEIYYLPKFTTRIARMQAFLLGILSDIEDKETLNKFADSYKDLEFVDHNLFAMIQEIINNPFFKLEI